MTCQYFIASSMYNNILFTIDKNYKESYFFCKNFQVHDKPIIVHENPIKNIEEQIQI